MQDKSTKILILATSYLPLIGGAELAIKYLTDHLPEFSFDLITARTNSSFASSERIGNVNVSRVGKAPSALNFLVPKAFLPLSIFFKARALLASNHYDMVYVLQASQAGGAAWLLRKLGYINQPLVLNIQEGKDFTKQSFLVRSFRRLIIGSADYYTVISAYLKDFLVSSGVDEENIFVIPNGVNISNERLEQNQGLKNKFGITNEKVIITVSRLVEKNGIADLIRSMVFVKDNYSEPVKLLIVGGGELESDLKNLSQTLGLTSDVIFVGGVDNEEVPKYLSLAEVFVRPSYSEGLGISFLEAMASSVPIIASKVGGIVDFLQEDQTGLYCAVGDSQDIGRKIITLLLDKDLHNRLASQGKELVKRVYDWDVIANQFRNFYGDIIGK